MADERIPLLELFREVTRLPRNAFLDSWLDRGKQVMGIFCLSNPLEIITAAGMMPYRIRGCRTATCGAASSVLLSNQVCSFVHNATDLMLSGEYDFLAGLLPRACQQLSRAVQAVDQHRPLPFQYTVTIPRRRDETTFPYYLNELQTLIRQIEAHFGVTIREEDLDNAIRLHNAIREKMMRLYSLRMQPHPPLSGADALAVSQAALAIPPAVFDEMLGDLLEILADTQRVDAYRARIAVAGGELEGTAFIEQIERMGGLSVVELICFGWPFFRGQVPEGPGSPLERLARFAFDREPYEREDIVRDFQIDGVIFQRLKFCDPFALSQVRQVEVFEECGVPILCLEQDFLACAQGQNETRIQAFLEKIGK